MTQIIFDTNEFTTIAAIAVGGALTTDNVQALPQWAPPIQYVGTTVPWMAYYLRSSSTTGLTFMKAARRAHVYAYGRRSTLRGGRECVGLSIMTSRPFNAVNFGVRNLIILTYRAVGEVVRP